jgi:hypothetical protein
VKPKEIEDQLDKNGLSRWRALQQIGVSIALLPGNSPESAVDWQMTYDKTGDRMVGIAGTVREAIDAMYQYAIRRCFLIEPRKPAHVQDWEESEKHSHTLVKLWKEEEWELNLLGHRLHGRLLRISLQNGEEPQFYWRTEIENKILLVQASYDQFVSVKELEANTTRRWQVLQRAAALGGWPELAIKEIQNENGVSSFHWSCVYDERSSSGGIAESHPSAIDRMYFAAALRGFLPEVPWRELAAEYPDEPLFRDRAAEAYTSEQEMLRNDLGLDRLLEQQELGDFADKEK